MRFVLSLVTVLALVGPAVAQPKLPNLPPDLMAPTDPLSPADERKQFTLPAGFDVQLVASEPDIQKPMQMAWDAKGRLWVTTSYHYPFASADKATDKVFVLSDFDPQTGKAKKVSTFTSDLNIPIGVLPLPDGKGVLVSSVGEIRKYKVAEADGGPKSEGFEVLFKGFGSRDTHGMYNSYTLMPDGWVYSCHGFANESTVRDRSGNEVTMKSGHTFRFKPDGSKIEVWTRGQVNPFGMTVDPWFNLYTADCHSKPITQLIPGAYYDSFGKPHDGLGFAPHVTAHSHNSTGLCGLAWYDADHFPKDYLGTMFVGNVVTNRINFDRIEWRGASPVAKELPDFLVSKDRWFRPVDIKLGPDGALYVADFYNKIVGHYEVDLKDPRRDKDRGRIWRIVWTGKDGKGELPKPAYSDLTKEKPEDLAKLLGSPNLAVRMVATNECLQRELDLPLLKAITAVATTEPRAAPHFLWIFERKGAFKEPMDMITFAYVAVAGTKGQAIDLALPHNMFRVLISRDKLPDDFRKHVCERFEKLLENAKVLGSAPSTIPDFGNQVARVYAELAARHPHADFVPLLVSVLKKCPADDTHLRQGAKIALRNCLRGADAWPKGDDAIYVEMAVAIPDRKAAEYLSSRVASNTFPADKLAPAVEHIARYGSAENEHRLVQFLFARENAEALKAALAGVQARGSGLSAESRDLFLRSARNAVASEHFTGAPNAAMVKRVAWGVQALNALHASAGAKANELKLEPDTATMLVRIVGASAAPVEVRVGAADALLRYSPADGVNAIRPQLSSPSTPEPLRLGLLLAAAGSNHKDARAEARDALKTVPYRTAVPIGLALASTKAGAEDLLTAVKEGKAPTRLLQEKAIVERLKGTNPNDWQKRVADLTKNIPPADQRIAEVIKKRSTGFAAAKIDKAEGQKLFVKHCAACHRIGDTGGKIAPQLDGVGVRGAERLLEDILDPNRNVDQAFRARSITLTSDKTLTALALRTEGKVLVVADLEGKEQRIPLDEIATNRATMLSAMPANFADVVPEADLYQIVAYLLDQRAKEPKKE